MIFGWVSVRTCMVLVIDSVKLLDCWLVICFMVLMWYGSAAFSHRGVIIDVGFNR